MIAIGYLSALVLMPVLAMRGTWYRGAYGAVAVIAVLVAFVVASPWPVSGTPEAQMIAEFMNRWRGEFGLFFLALGIGAVLGAMLYRRPTPTPPL
jgi:H+/gluconate symporter-like permease